MLRVRQHLLLCRPRNTAGATATRQVPRLRMPYAELQIKQHENTAHCGLRARYLPMRHLLRPPGAPETTRSLIKPACSMSFKTPAWSRTQHLKTQLRLVRQPALLLANLQHLPLLHCALQRPRPLAPTRPERGARRRRSGCWVRWVCSSEGLLPGWQQRWRQRWWRP